MTFLYNNVVSYDSYPSSTTYLSYCNAPVVVDTLYQPRYFQEIYYAPEPPAQIQVVRQRLPDPPPDVIERITVVPQPKKYVYQVVEVPTKPPPVIRERVVQQPPNPALCGGTYRVQVPHNSAVQSPTFVQSSSNVQIAPSYVQQSPTYVQASSSYVQQSPTYVQASPSYVQASPSYIQQTPLIYSSPPVFSI